MLSISWGLALPYPWKFSKTEGRSASVKPNEEVMKPLRQAYLFVWRGFVVTDNAWAAVAFTT